MAFRLIPKAENSESASLDGRQVTLRYDAWGEAERQLVEQYVLAGSPINLFTAAGMLWRQDVRLDHTAHHLYDVAVSYGSARRQVGSMTFAFDTTGATVRIFAAKEHIATYGPDGLVDDPADPHKGAIGITGDGEVEGCETIIPALALTYTFRHPQGYVNEAHARQLSRVTGRTNANSFRGFAAGELLFAGAIGSDGTETEAEVNYTFIASENATDLRVGDIQNIVKAGHHYAHVEFHDEVESGHPVRRPKWVHIERVYDPVDFAQALGWS